MTRETITLVASADTWIRENDTHGPTEQVLPVGLLNADDFRSLVQFPEPNWAGVVSLVSATLRLRNTDQVKFARGATPRIYVRRATELWTPPAGVTWDNQPAATTTDQVDSGTLPTADNAWCSFNVTAIVRRWAPALAGGSALKQYGFKLTSYDEGSTTRRTEFWSRQKDVASAPHLVLVVERNSPPEAPINLSPSGDEAIGAIVAGAITFRGERVDPDAGDYITATEVAVHDDTATDGAPGVAIVSTIEATTAKPVLFAVPVSSALLTVGDHYRWRGRTRDLANAWGPWSSLGDGRFIADSVPSAPINLAIDTTSLTPHFFGSIDDPDPGAELGAVRIVVYQDTTAGAVLKWDSGFDDSGGTRFEVAYGGTPLEVGMTGLRWAAAVRDQYGAEGPLSAFQFWTPAAVTGPDAMSPIDVETKQDSLTPDLTVGHSAAFDAYELEVARFADGSGLLWDVPVTPVASMSSTIVTYAGTALTWGRTYYWRAKVRVAGTTWTDFSPWYPFYVNALPLAPVGSVDGAVDSGGYSTITTATATLRFPFSDPDVAKGYAEEPTRREIEISELDGTAFGASPYVITSGITDTMTTDALVAETLYRARARYDDTSDQRSPWSAYVYFKTSTAPTIAEETAIDIADPNPLVDWTFAGAAGKTQRRLRVQVFADATDELVFDSGPVDSTETSYEVPGDILENATVYRYRLEAFDTDLLSDVLDGGPWTTDFDVPDPVTGLQATAHSDTSSVELTWDVATIDPDYFWRYHIYRLNDLGTWIRVGSVDDLNDPTFTDVEAPNGTVSYAVTVSNGWAESDQAEAVVTLTLAGEWFISDPNDPSLRFALINVVEDRSRIALQQESFEPLGRSVPLVVKGEQLAPADTLSLWLSIEEGYLVGLLMRAANVTPYVVLKNPFGGVLKVSLGSIDTQRQPGGAQSVSFSYETVA